MWAPIPFEGGLHWEQRRLAHRNLRRWRLFEVVRRLAGQELNIFEADDMLYMPDRSRIAVDEDGLAGMWIDAGNSVVAIFGPYVHLEAGTWQLSLLNVRCLNGYQLLFDIVYDGGRSVIRSLASFAPGEVCQFTLEHLAQNFEVRFYTIETPVLIGAIVVTRVC